MKTNNKRTCTILIMLYVQCDECLLLRDALNENKRCGSKQMISKLKINSSYLFCSSPKITQRKTGAVIHSPKFVLQYLNTSRSPVHAYNLYLFHLSPLLRMNAMIIFSLNAHISQNISVYIKCNKKKLPNVLKIIDVDAFKLSFQLTYN